MTDENKDEEDGITIEVSSNIDEESNESGTDENNSSQDETEGDFLDEDGTVTLDGDYEGTVRLVGTVHVSQKTRDRVQGTISEEQPDVVAIELDRERLYGMFERGADVVEGGDDKQEEQGGLREIMRRQQEQRFGGEDTLSPGEADMIPATDAAIRVGSRVALIDMSMQELKEQVKQNAYDEEGNLDVKVLNKIKEGSFREVIDSLREFGRSQQEMQETLQEDGIGGVVEEMEEGPLDQVTEQMEPLRELAPEVVEALIDERDRHMAGRLHWLRKNGHDTVGVMGRGHLQGVYDYLQNPENLDDDYVVKPDWYEYNTVSIN